MMRTTVRLLIKTYRFELIAITLACLAIAGTELFLTTQLDANALPKECQFNQNISVDQGFATQPQEPVSGQPLVDTCEAKISAFYEIDQHAAEIMGFGAALPVLAGILIGVAVVGRELEAGTASLAWTLSRSRRRWYLTRALLVGAILGGVLFVPALAANVLEHARQPLVDPGSSFNDGGIRGPVLVMLGLLTYAIAVVAGAVVGRQLPAVIIALAVTLAVILGLENGLMRWELSLAEWRLAASSSYNVDVVFDQEYRDRATGLIVDQNSVMAAAPQTDGGPDGAWIDARYDSVALILPGSRYGDVVAGESAAICGAVLMLLGLGMLVVNHRRPD
jgi:hypothetical protein